MKVRLTRKFSDLINGVDLSKAHPGDTLELTDRDARTLIAEGWAESVSGSPGRDRAHDTLKGPRAPGRKKR